MLDFAEITRLHFGIYRCLYFQVNDLYNEPNIHKTQFIITIIQNIWKTPVIELSLIYLFN